MTEEEARAAYTKARTEWYELAAHADSTDVISFYNEMEVALEALLEAVRNPVQKKEPRAAACENCGYPLRPYNKTDTSTWRTDNFCSARCKGKAGR